MEFFTPGHLIVVAIVALVLFFGWKQLPEMSRSVGRSLRIFKTEIKGMGEDDKARDRATTDPESPRALESPTPPVARAEPVIRETVVRETVVPERASVDAQRTRPRPAPSPIPHADGPTDTSSVNGSANGRTAGSTGAQ